MDVDMAEAGFSSARQTMVERQLRPWQVLDERVLAALGAVPREDFVPQARRHSAYADLAVPLGVEAGSAQHSLLPPNVCGRALQSLALRGDERVLILGDASGYLGACAARLGGRVLCLEADPQLAAAMAARFAALGIDAAEARHGDALRDGLPVVEEGDGDDCWDAVLVAATLAEAPGDWLARLAGGGRLFAILGDPRAAVMTATLISRVGQRDWRREGLFETRAPALQAGPAKVEFCF